MFTQEQVQAKIAKQIQDGELVMGSGKVVIPIPDSLLDPVTRARIYIYYNARKKTITDGQNNGYKGSLDQNNAIAIWSRLPITEGGITQLDVLNFHYNKNTGGTLGFSQCFRTYMGYVRDSETLIKRLKEFFKYMPQLTTIYTPYLNPDRYDNLDGYCCEDCDGPESTWRSWSIDNAITSIAIELDRIKILP